jgi:hypothetical protein
MCVDDLIGDGRKNNLMIWGGGLSHRVDWFMEANVSEERTVAIFRALTLKMKTILIIVIIIEIVTAVKTLHLK